MKDMLEFQLFRVKVFPSPQGVLFEKPPGPVALLRSLVESRPSGELRRGVTWHIANIETVDADGVYFRFGKTTKATIETFKEGVFVDQEYEASPYTHVLLDVALGVAAIAKKLKLAPTPTGIVGRLCRVLNESPYARDQGASIEVAELQDPQDFLVHLREAWSICRFSMTFSRPNPFDANRDIVQPLQKCLGTVNGEKGNVDLRGDNLNREPLEDLARSAAATGDAASARLRPDQHARPVTRHLKGKAVTVSEEDVTQPEQKRGLLQRIREVYGRIRGQDR